MLLIAQRSIFIGYQRFVVDIGPRLNVEGCLLCGGDCYLREGNGLAAEQVGWLRLGLYSTLDF